MRPPEPRTIRAFQRRLLAWYAVHGRDLPWRRTREPYRILVSEIMLQQTQVHRVLPKYRQFLRRFPTLRSLAAADVDEVRRLWYPLGYNVRPVRLHMIARETLAQYRGRLPDDGERLRRLPGVGRYTAGAILSFAYGRDEPDPRHQRPPRARPRLSGGPAARPRSRPRSLGSGGHPRPARARL